MSEAALELRGVGVRLGARALVRGLDARVAAGAVLTVMGPSGSGKSSLLSFLGGFLEKPFQAEGRVRLGDADITDAAPQARRAGLLFQDALLFPHMTVEGNLLFAIPRAVRGREARGEIAARALARVGLEGLGARDPQTLSGGERARVALARTLLAAPRFLLLDEPFSRLDAPLRAGVRALVLREARERGLPVVLVTHDAADAEAAGGTLVRLDADDPPLREGDGR